MKIILKYLLTNVSERKARTFVMLLSILLSAMLLFVSFSIGVSYESAQRKMARGMAGSATVSVQSVEGGIHADDIPALSHIQTKAGIVEGTSLYHENGYYETVDLLAADMEALNQINQPRLPDGGKVTAFSGNQIILPDRFTSKYGIEKGDTVTLQISGSPVDFEVTEIAAYDTVFLRHTRGATALLPLETLKQILGWNDGYSKILLEPAEHTATDHLISELQSTLGHGKYRISEIVNEAQIIADARQKSMPFFLISFFSLTMSIFIIYSSYKVITLDRLPVIGTFRSIGATEKTVTRILLLESLFYGCTGGLIGIPIGIIVLKVLLQGMGKSLSQGIEIPVVISIPGVFLSFAVAVIVSLFSAWLPVRKASRLPVKDIISGTVEEKRIPRPLIVGTGIVLFIVSARLPYFASGTMLYLAGGFSLLGLIAARNMKDNRNITQNITLLFISISAIIAISVVGDFVTTYISDVFHGAELQGFADGRMQPEFVEQVEEMEGIKKVLPLYVFDSKIQAEGMPFSRLEGTGDLELYNSMLALTYTDMNMQEQAVSAFQTGERAIVLSENSLKQTGFSIGDAIMVQIRALFGNTSNWSRTVDEFNTDALSTVGTFLEPMHSMTYFILLLATIGVINNLLINHIQKRRTIAMYKSIGLSNRQNRKMTLIEGFSSGLIGGVIAILVSYMEIQTIFLVAGPKISMVPELDAWTFLKAGALGIVVTLLGSIVPMIKSRNMKLVEEIKFE